jgi:POT family
MFIIPAGLMFISCISLYTGAKIYVRVKPEGSPFIGIVRVFVAAFKKRRLSLPYDPIQELFQVPHVSSIVSKLPYTEQFK